jgi:A/G-specific adenine glycosylase
MRRPDAAPTTTTSGTDSLPAARVQRFQRRLLEWASLHRRDLPWRTTRDPWRILVSEFMLQQTQVDRVVGYYGRFLDAFPTAVDCARARPGEVVRLWSGLGYNRRALNLHRAAQAIDEVHGGIVPEDEVALRALAGVGPYTARAVLSFAFEADVATVDTNVVRVLARCVAGTGVTLRQAQSLADRLLPAGRSWEFNQAMFDLGATVCTAARPACARCPLRLQCRWRREGDADRDPWRASPSVRAQAPFVGSDRQGRGRLVHALRQGDVSRAMLASACGWPDDPARADRITKSLVAEGFAEWTHGRPSRLQLR